MVFPTSITLTTRYYGTTHQEKDVYFVALLHAKKFLVKVIDILSPDWGLCVSKFSHINHLSCLKGRNICDVN